MELRKEYKSFADINKDLEIFKIERDISHLKFKKEFEATKDSLEAKNLIGSTPAKIIGYAAALAKPLKNVALTLLIKRIFK
ncbi:DUF6327 family protein [Flavobacterium litorale]|uniref:Glutaminyl-tRNA synthetase n=1 Tax=Flavobacterium litorale TaxID=2856519 RepID=A0ABX8V846_9FLAO|nr:DUF6327 family protein [Flavobacterium litorale]QYJ69034.1 hypothetical protein K1I41_03860 [Flavobacterium litorale]